MDIEGALIDDVGLDECTCDLAALGLEELQLTLGKERISLTDAVNAFMAKEDKESSVKIFSFTMLLMSSHAAEFDRVTAPGEKWIDTLVDRFFGLPYSCDRHT